MSCADPGALAALLAFLRAHRPWAYPLLFLGAYFETVPPLSLVVPGEAFFLCGAVLAGAGALDLGAVATALYAGGLLGDNSSYWMGRRCGAGLFAWIARRPLLGRFMGPSVYRRGVEFFRRRGGAAVFTARLSGPLSWVTPTLAGAFELDYRTFLGFNTPGVLLGISEFLLAGYFLGRQLPALLHAAESYTATAGAVAILLWALWISCRVAGRCRRRPPRAAPAQPNG